MEKKTPLYETHLKYSGKMVPFAGWLLPVQYSGITAEHMAVRTAAGIFDVSHMGEILLEGEDALKNIQRLVTNDCSDMYDGRVRYSPMCNENGGVVDDVLIYRISQTKYMIVVNASNSDKDAKWIQERLSGNVEFKNISAEMAQIAVQGPAAIKIIASLSDESLLPQKYYHFTNLMSVAGIPCLVSKTGYTGENGFELYTENRFAPELWENIMRAGESEGLIPCGLGARDTLRLEGAMPLYGHEMNDEITPFETGLGMFVKMNKPDFFGKAALEQKNEPAIERIGLELLERGIAREGAELYCNSEKIGRVTSGTMAPFLKKAVAMALVKKGSVAPGDELTVIIRDKKVAARAVKLPFYKKQ